MASQFESRQPSRVICSFYLKRSCTQGDACRFLHPANLNATETQNGTICSHFLRGKCTFGNRCKKIHPLAASDKATHPIYAKNSQPCRYFVRGVCDKGDACPFTHNLLERQKYRDSQVKAPSPPPSTSTVCVTDALALASRLVGVSSDTNGNDPAGEEAPAARQYTNRNNAFKAVAEPPGPAPVSAVRTFLGCTAHFNAGAAVELVLTPFESRRVLLSNLPLSVTEADVIFLVSSFADSASVLVHRTAEIPSATVEFATSADAASAARRLDNTPFESRKLAARLDLRARAVEGGTGAVLNRKVRLTWYAPTRSAIAHYSIGSVAEEQSKAMDGSILDGCRIKTFFRLPTRRPSYTTSFTVMIRNLSEDTSYEKLLDFSGALMISFEPQPDYYTSPVEKVRAQLERFGPVESLVVLPQSNGNHKVSAFAQFSSAEAAAAAAKGLQNVPHDFLGKKPLLIQHNFSVKYSIRARQFTKVKADLDRFSEAVENGRIRYYVNDIAGKPADPVTVLLDSPDPKSMGRAKVGVEKILQGELLLVDGKTLWDEYFDSFVGQKFIQRICADADFFAKYDARMRTIRVFGNVEARAQARQMILDKLKEVHAWRHVLPLEKEHVRVLLGGGLDSLQQDIGQEKVILNVVSRTLTVQGDIDVVRRVRRSIANMHASTTASSVSSESQISCPVCFCDVSDPVKLECGHEYCRSCLQHYLRSAAGSAFSVLKCVAESHVDSRSDPVPCNVNISYGVIRQLLTSAEETNLLEASFLSHIHEHPNDFRYCPSADCQVIYRPGPSGTVLECPACLVRICASCHTEFHEDMSCGDYQDHLTGGLAALAKWKAENDIKQCPNCRADIEKNGGCNHIACLLCKAHICWFCMGTFDKDGIYPHMQSAHGNYGLY